MARNRHRSAGRRELGTIARRRLTFYLDADIPHIIRVGIGGSRKDTLYAGGPKAPAEDTKDPVWLRRAGDGDWVVITRDKRLRRRRGERREWMKRGLRVFVLSSAGNMTIWETHELLVKRFAEIEEYAREHDGPYIVSVTKNGLNQLEPKKN